MNYGRKMLGDTNLSSFSSACMYACIEVALCGIAHGIGRPIGPGGGAHQKSAFNVPTPRVPSVPRHARWLILAHDVCFLQPTLLWEAKGDLFPHVGGGASHRASLLCLWCVF